MKGWISRFLRSREQKQIDARNAERKHLCAEYASNTDPARRGEIIARLMELNGEADIKGAAERIGFELEGICRRVHADSIRSTPPAPQAHDHFEADVRHFRSEYCGGISAKPAYVAGCQFSAESGAVEGNACPSGEVKA